MINEMINSLLEIIYNYNLMVILLFGAGIAFTIALRGYNLNVKDIFNALSKSTKDSDEGISGVKALMIATSSRIGNGNIAGVSSAILIGGPGALFWMWITALLGMATSFVEATLAQLYKYREGKNYIGGTPFYILKGLGKKKLGAVYAIIALFTFGTGYMGIQSKTIAENFSTLFKDSGVDSNIIKFIVGAAILSVFLAVVLGGIKSIANFAGYVMPIMGGFYLIGAVIIIGMNIGKFPEVMKLIFSSAFNLKAGVGGVIGFTMAKAMSKGAARGVFSNEAGIGSATYAAGAANAAHPVQQGLLQSLSTFIDTIIVCTASGFIILFSGYWTAFAGNSEATSTLIQASIASTVGVQYAFLANLFVSIAILLFGFTTIIGLYYYSEVSLKYFTHENKMATRSLQFFISAFLLFAIFVKADILWNLADVTTFFLVLINVFALLPLLKYVRKLTKDYRQQRKAGVLVPVFDNKNEIKNAEFWNK